MNNTTLNDRGHILIWTVAALAMIFVAVLATARAFQARLDASLRETLAAEQRAAGDIAEAAIDAWMSNPAIANQIINPLVNNPHGRDWISPLGESCPAPSADPPRNTCWHISGVEPVTFTDSNLRGGEAKRTARDVTIEIAAGCHTSPIRDPYEDCQQVRTITRRYERSVFAHYQLHYENDTAPDAAFDDPWFNGNDGIPDTADDQPEAQLRGLRVVFTSADTLNGPLRYSGNDKVLYCGSPKFKLIESKSPLRPIRAGAGCLSQPSWLDDSTTPPTLIQWPISDTDPLDADRFVVQGDVLTLPTISAPSGCPLTTVNYNHNIHTTAKSLRVSGSHDCPGEPTQNVIPHAIIDGDIISSTGSVTIERLIVDGSVTVYAEGDIIVCGEIRATGHNPAGGPNVIALITRLGDVVLDPSGQPIPAPACGADLTTSLTRVSTNHDLSLINVAVLARQGAIYARNWYLFCTGICPTFEIQGSIAANHLGLYGIPDPISGGVTRGWSKDFTYPTDRSTTPNVDESFWLARPPWWPGFKDGNNDGSEWEPVGEVGSSGGITTPELVVSEDTVTVDEGSTTTLDVRLATPPSAAVTVSVISAEPTAATVTPSTLTFLVTNWYINQPVRIEGVDDADRNDESTTITLTGSNGGYDNLTETVAVDVIDKPPPTVSIRDTSAVEGSPLEFMVTLSRVHTSPVTVTWVTGDMSDTAYGFVDYDPGNPPQPVTITAGAATATISIPTIDNTTIEPDKTMTIRLTGASGVATVGTSTAQGTITEDDVPIFTAADAESFVVARDCVIDGMRWSANDPAIGHGTSAYITNYGGTADYCRNLYPTYQFPPLPVLDSRIPLGEDDPNSLPSPDGQAGQDALRDAIDALAIAAGLTQDQIDAAESP